MVEKYSDKIDLDKFYTKESVAIECLKNIDFNDYDLIIEPSAGSGSFFNKSDGKCLRFDPEKWKESKEWTFGTEDDFSFYVMGAAPKRLKMKPHENNRGDFIKVKPGFSISSVRSKFRNNLWKGNSSANGGVSWLTKPELVHRYENWIQDPNGGPKRRAKKYYKK